MGVRLNAKRFCSFMADGWFRSQWINKISKKKYSTPGAASRNLYVPYLLDSLTGEALFLELSLGDNKTDHISPGKCFKNKFIRKKVDSNAYTVVWKTEAPTNFIFDYGNTTSPHKQHFSFPPITMFYMYMTFCWS